LLTGRPPFGSGSAPQVVQRQLNDPMPPPSQLRPGVSSAVDAVMAKALSPAPKKRWTSASTFAMALGRALERQSGETKVPPAHDVDDQSVAESVRSVLAPTQGIEEVSQVSTLGKPEIIGRVRAAHLRVLSRILQHHVGESGMAKVTSQRPELAHAFSATLAPLSWVSLVELVAALEHARAIVPASASGTKTNRSFAHKVGRGTMSATFARLFGADPTSLAAETVLMALPTFWPRYHDWGEVDVGVGAGQASVTLLGFPGSIEVCAMIGAELERIVELTGAKAVQATHARCRCIAAAQNCEFRISWTA
jgi:hypothetical protein